jgi:chromate transporter
VIGTLAALVWVFARLGIVAVGGMLSILPEMQRQVVTVHHWMDAREFASLFALAQAAPGPNMMVVTLVGWRVAGLAGALTASLALVILPGILIFTAGRVWLRFRREPWLRDVQLGLNAVTIGLIAAAALLFTESVIDGWRSFLLMATATAVLATTKIHPLWVLAVGAICGMVGVV